MVTLQNALESEQLIEQFKIEYGKNAQNLFFEEHDIWHCVCGTINLSCDGECCICRAKKELLATYDFEKLKLKTNERLEKAEATRKDIIYDEAKMLMLMKDITSYEDAIEKFESISGWRDSIELITQCNHCIKEKKKQNNIIRSVIAAIFLLLVIVLSIIGTNMENDMRKTLSGKKIRGVYKYNCEYFYTKDTYTICFEDENYCDIYCKFTTDFDSGEDYCSYEEYKNVPYKITGGVFGLRFMWDKKIGPYRGAQPFEIDLSNGSVEMYTPNFSNDKPMHMSENY